MSAGIAGFLIGGLLCGGLGFIVASCLATENKHDDQKIYQAGYMEGYHDGVHLKESKYHGAV